MGKSLTSTGLVTLAMLSPAYSIAQGGSGAFALEEIVVTANRREESLQEVAMSVSAFTGEFFKDSGVTNLAGLEQYTPSLRITQVGDSNSTSIRIRGIGSVGSNAGIDPSVGVFIDGVYQGRAGMSTGDLIDIERVEVLRGPQGTLYGKNTAAGAISIYTKRPSTEYEGEFELRYDSEEQASVHGMVNIPLGDSLHATRISGYKVDGDHKYENTYDNREFNNADKWGLKARTLFDGSAEGLGEFLLSMDYSKEDTDCCVLAVSDYSGFSTLNAPATESPTAQFQQWLEETYNRTFDYASFEDYTGITPPDEDPFGDDYWVSGDVYNKIDVGGISLEWNKDIAGEHTLTFINAYRHYESDSAYDGDFGGYDAVEGNQDIDFDQYSSELRIASPGGETFDYQGGLYAFYSELDSVGTFYQTPTLTNMAPIFSLGGIALFPEGTLNIDDNEFTTTSFAAFGQVVWNITDDFSATLGLRLTHEEKDREGTQVTIPDSPIDAPPVAGPNQVFDETRSDTDLSPSLNLRYFFTPEWMGYASISQGFKSGGFNQRRELEGTSAEFDEETATNYEIGWKGSSADRRLQFNGTLYYTEYDDFQSQTFDGATLEVTNAGTMESYGSELELLFLPTPDLVLSTAIGYNKAEYDEFDKGQCTAEFQYTNFYLNWEGSGLVPIPPGVSPCNQDLAGEPLDNAPEWTVSTFVQYHMELPGSLLGVARLEHSYIDEFYLDQDLDENLKNDSVDLVNARFTLSNENDTWEVAIWGLNLLDEEYYAIGLDIPVLGGYAGVAAPGDTYGITLRYKH